jgi:hypothetical protein
MEETRKKRTENTLEIFSHFIFQNLSELVGVTFSITFTYFILHFLGWEGEGVHAPGRGGSEGLHGGKERELASERMSVVGSVVMPLGFEADNVWILLPIGFRSVRPRVMGLIFDNRPIANYNDIPNENTFYYSLHQSIKKSLHPKKVFADLIKRV